MSEELERLLSPPTAKLQPTPPGPRLRVVAPIADGAPDEGDGESSMAQASATKAMIPDVSPAALRRHDIKHDLLPKQLFAHDVYKSYRKGPVEVPVLRGVSCNVHQGEFLAIVGQSGSGKSTLLHLLGTLDAPDRGEIYYAGHRVDNLPAAGKDRLRNNDFGMIFQFYHLLPELSTLENVLSPLMIAQGALRYWRHRNAHRRRAEALLDMVGLGHRLKHRPRELSGGEMQRAAIARALVTEPRLLLADEPTGNLDQATGREIIRILRDLNHQQNLTIVMVTHDPAVADQADRIVRLANGRIEQ